MRLNAYRYIRQCTVRSFVGTATGTVLLATRQCCGSGFIQATGEAFSPQREHPALQKIKYINFFYFVGHFCPPGSGSNPDPDPVPQHCNQVYQVYRVTIGRLRISNLRKALKP